ncbi:MAG: cell division protein ZapB [Bacteroidales bacterium]|nr:cell division protein ZapB [Bacteroidales bacterium]
MTIQEEQALHRFETRVRQLILSYRELQAENQQLKKAVSDGKAAMEELRRENKALQADYNNLKLARMIAVNSEDQQAAKNRLAKIIREVDKCIALLNV